jgi:glycosyltransferase involved in cell wall biosynthesis
MVTTSSPAPIVLFFPAFDEEATVAAVVERAPATVLGHPVQVVVVDDGSTDHTAVRARAAGAEVISLGTNHGLGAAVARGLAEAAPRGAAAIAFADADGEYAPEELHVLVAPILAGDADYVVGSRFASGGHRNMRPHRRLGNVVLTRILARLSRTPITDGQSGYRALSAQAAAEARLEHDYNYAQVLTLDLLGRGYRYAEVPISYRFRSEGTSFVRLGPYLRKVIPAVWRVQHRHRSAPVDTSGELLGRVNT